MFKSKFADSLANPQIPKPNLFGFFQTTRCPTDNGTEMRSQLSALLHEDGLHLSPQLRQELAEVHVLARLKPRFRRGRARIPQVAVVFTVLAESDFLLSAFPILFFQ